MMFSFRKSKNGQRKATSSYEGWLEIARVTLLNRDALGFHSGGAAEEMAAAGYAVTQRGGSVDEAIDAVQEAYDRNFFYSTPHEHPCDEWKWRDVMKAAS